MISTGVDGRLFYMTYPDIWRGTPKQVQFLKPESKPIPTNRYHHNHNLPLPLNHNVVSPGANGGPRLIELPNHTSSSLGHQTSVKDEYEETSNYHTYPKIFSHPFSTIPSYPNVFQPNYADIMRFPSTQTMVAAEQYAPVPQTNSSSFLPVTYNTTTNYPPTTYNVTKEVQSNSLHGQNSFKVPSGKEGSMKHRILIRPDDVVADADKHSSAPLNLHQKSSVPIKKNAYFCLSPPVSPTKSIKMGNNYAAGSLVQLGNGELKRIESMKTEDFISSAENSPNLKLEESTIVKIEESTNLKSATISLICNHGRAQVNIECPLEHPYFIYGQSWASCNPEKTMQCYGLKVSKIQVGDIVIALVPKYPPLKNTTFLSPVTPSERSSTSSNRSHCTQQSNEQPLDLHNTNLNQSQLDQISRKRRWSAPDQIEEDQMRGKRLV